MKNINTEIYCHVRDINNNIKFFCTITYRQGIQFVLSVQTVQPIELQDNSFVCFDNQNNRYILNNLLYEENNGKNFGGKHYFFESLVLDLNKHYIGEKNLNLIEKIKFNSLSFTFPLINSFFYNIDYINVDSYDKTTPVLKYIKSTDFIPFTVNGFKIELITSYCCGGGKIGGNGGHYDLLKSIKISSETEQDLQNFIDIISSLMNFFSICLRKKLLLTKVWSDAKYNSLNVNTEIKTFQHHILNKEYEDVRPFKNLATYALLKENFEKIFNRFYETKKEEYELFTVFCDLYMRYNDSPIEILPQMKFLPLMQGIEAYVGHLDFNKLPKIPKRSKKALKLFKEENASLPMIDLIEFPSQLPFQTKINNVIENFNIESIIQFKLDKKCNYKLINQMVKIRNYYTHYGTSPKINDEDFYDAMDYAKIICEILIMKELQFTDQQIKISLKNNYYYLDQWNNKYCSLVKDRKTPKGLEKCVYVGETDIVRRNKYIKYSLYYKKNNRNKEVVLFAKNMMKYGRTKIKKINMPLDECSIQMLGKEFKQCYENFLESEKQIKLRKDRLNK